MVSFIENLILANHNEAEQEKRKKEIFSKRVKTLGITSIVPKTQESNINFDLINLMREEQCGENVNAKTNSKKKTKPKSQKSITKAALTLSRKYYENHSKFYLSELYVDTKELDKAFEDKEIFSIKRAFAQIKAPDYFSPEYANWVLLGIIAKKTDVKETKPSAWESNAKNNSNLARFNNNNNNSNNNNITYNQNYNRRRKFIVVTLTDLVHDLDLFIMGDAFEKLWKVRVGDVVAILNPGTLKKPERSGAQASFFSSGRSNAFALSLTDSDDEIVEIGRASDIGLCKSITSKGTRCTQWVNIAKAEYCDFHVELSLKKTRHSRPEINNSSTWAMMGMSGGKNKSFVDYKVGSTRAVYSNNAKNSKYNRDPQNPISIPPKCGSIVNDSTEGGGGNLYINNISSLHTANSLAAKSVSNFIYAKQNTSIYSGSRQKSAISYFGGHDVVDLGQQKKKDLKKLQDRQKERELIQKLSKHQSPGGEMLRKIAETQEKKIEKEKQHVSEEDKLILKKSELPSSTDTIDGKSKKLESIMVSAESVRLSPGRSAKRRRVERAKMLAGAIPKDLSKHISFTVKKDDQDDDSDSDLEIV